MISEDARNLSFDYFLSYRFHLNSLGSNAYVWATYNRMVIFSNLEIELQPKIKEIEWITSVVISISLETSVFSSKGFREMNF